MVVVNDIYVQQCISSFSNLEGGACEKCYVVKTRGVWNDMSKVVLSSDDDDKN